MSRNWCNKNYSSTIKQPRIGIGSDTKKLLGKTIKQLFLKKVVIQFHKFNIICKYMYMYKRCKCSKLTSRHKTNIKTSFSVEESIVMCLPPHICRNFLITFNVMSQSVKVLLYGGVVVFVFLLCHTILPIYIRKFYIEFMSSNLIYM